MSQLVAASFAAGLVVIAWTSLQMATADRDAGRRLVAVFDLFAAWSCLSLAFAVLLVSSR